MYAAAIEIDVLRHSHRYKYLPPEPQEAASIDEGGKLKCLEGAGVQFARRAGGARVNMGFS